MGPLSDGGGDAEDDALPDLDQSDLPGPSTSAARPPEKRARLTAKSKKVWKWERTDLEPRELPTSQVRPKNVENCRYEVQMFLEMMGSDNIDLITTQTNLKRTKLAIEKNRPMYLPLYQYKMEVALALMYAESFDRPLSAAAILLRRGYQEAENGDPVGDADPAEAVRLDGHNHWPQNVAQQQRRCKLPGCKQRSVVWCTKCRVYLCLKKDRNCFIEYHTV